jgi:hypothetical protein
LEFPILGRLSFKAEADLSLCGRLRRQAVQHKGIKKTGHILVRGVRSRLEGVPGAHPYPAVRRGLLDEDYNVFVVEKIQTMLSNIANDIKAKEA